MKIQREGDKVKVSSLLDAQDLLHAIPANRIFAYLNANIVNNDCIHKEIQDFIEDNINYLKEVDLRLRTRLAVHNMFWQDLKKESDIAFFEFFIRKKDAYNFHQQQINFFGKGISFEDNRYDNLISCKFPDGKGKFYEPIIHIKDVIRVHKSYSSPECLVEFGQLMNDKEIDWYTFDQIQSADWLAEDIKGKNTK